MSMVFHEFRYLASRYRWLILLWFIWWGFLIVSRGAGNFVEIWIGLLVVPSVIFFEISPVRSGAALRVRPMLDRQRICARWLFLMVVCGLPMWISEWAYLGGAPDMPVDFRMWAVLERVVIVSLIWVLFAAVGWWSRSIWQGVILGFLTLVLFAEPGVPGWYNLNNQVQAWLQIEEYLRIPIKNSLADLFVYSVAIAGAWLLGGWLRQRLGGLTVYYQWVLVGLAVVVLIPLRLLILHGYQDVVRILSTDQQAMVEIEQSVSHTLRPPGPSSCRINRRDGEQIYQEYYSQVDTVNLPSRVVGETASTSSRWRWDDGRSLFFDTEFSGVGSHSSGYVAGSVARQIQESVQRFLGRTPLLIAERGAGAEQEYLKKPVELHGENACLPTTIEANNEMEYSRLGEWVEIPSDGGWHATGALGSVQIQGWVVESFEPILRINYHRPHLFSKLSGGVIPKVWIAFWNEASNQWFIVNVSNHDWVREGGYSASPKFQFHFSEHVLGQFRHGIASERAELFEKFRNSRVFVLEGDFLGRQRLNLTADLPDEQDSTYHSNHLDHRRLLGIDSQLYQKLKQGADGAHSEQSLRQWCYRIVQAASAGNGILPDGVRKADALTWPLPKEADTEIWQNIIERESGLLSLFSSNLQRDTHYNWLLRNALRGADQSRAFAATLAHLGWLDDDPDTAKQVLGKFDNKWGALQDLENRLGLKDEAEIMAQRGLQQRLRRDIGSLDFSIDHTWKHLAPDQWQAGVDGYRKSWARERPYLAYSRSRRDWHSGIALSRLTGDEQPLRDILEVVARGAMQDDITLWGGGDLISPQHVWIYFCRLFGEDKEVEKITGEGRAVRARYWLDQEWQYVAEQHRFDINLNTNHKN